MNRLKVSILGLLSLACCCINGNAQMLDSLKYEFGYLYYHHYGKGDTIILLSGGPGNNCMQLEPMAEMLGKKYHVILPEQRGTGLSIPSTFDSTTINLNTAGADLFQLLNHLKLTRAIIVGHSWGGMLAMNFAAQYPSRVRSLLLIAPGPFEKWDSNFKAIQQNLRSRLGKAESELLDSLTKKIIASTASPDERVAQRKLVRSAYIYDKSELGRLFPLLEAGVSQKMQQLMWSDLSKNLHIRKSLANYKGPIKVISGRQDILSFNSYELKIARPSVQLFWVEQCGHFPMYEQEEVFYPLVFDLLKSKR